MPLQADEVEDQETRGVARAESSLLSRSTCRRKSLTGSVSRAVPGTYCYFLLWLLYIHVFLTPFFRPSFLSDPSFTMTMYIVCIWDV